MRKMIRLLVLVGAVALLGCPAGEDSREGDHAGHDHAEERDDHARHDHPEEGDDHAGHDHENLREGSAQPSLREEAR